MGGRWACGVDSGLRTCILRDEISTDCAQARRAEFTCRIFFARRCRTANVDLINAIYARLISVGAIIVDALLVVLTDVCHDWRCVDGT